MRVLVMGASGTIGAALVERLVAAGHDVVLGVRDPRRLPNQWRGLATIDADYADATADANWSGRLQGIDAVVNVVGIFREDGSQTFERLHVKGPLALFRAATAVGVERVVQVSALGAAPGAGTAYLASKGEADAVLAGLGTHACIVRPSLVFTPQGASTRWFALLAALPMTPLPDGGGQRVQPVHLDDLCEAILRLLEAPRMPQVLEAVGARALTLRNYLSAFKRAMAIRPLFVSVPGALVRAVAPLMARRRGSLVTPDSMRMLDAGNTADAAGMSAVLGHAPRAPESFLDGAAAASLRREAALAWLLPVLRWAMAAMWIATGLVSMFAYPREASLELLARTGITGMLGPVALHGAALLDIALGVAILALPRWRRPAYLAQLLLITGYTVIITAFLPEYWAHPYGPVLKNLPLLAAIALLHQLDDDRRGPPAA
jgi:uncharacterized protein YbjT (DUF2867 family)